jgi:hypothetical protein
MEHLFSPCTRLYDLLDSHDLLDNFHVDPRELMQEQSLDVSTEDFLSAKRAFTYADLYALLGNESTVLWLTPHASVMPTNSRWVRYWGELGDQTDSFSTPTVKTWSPWLALPSIYWRFPMLLYDCWQQAPFIQSF